MKRKRFNTPAALIVGALLAASLAVLTPAAGGHSDGQAWFPYEA